MHVALMVDICRMQVLVCTSKICKKVTKGAFLGDQCLKSLGKKKKKSLHYKPPQALQPCSHGDLNGKLWRIRFILWAKHALELIFHIIISAIKHLARITERHASFLTSLLASPVGFLWKFYSSCVRSLQRRATKDITQSFRSAVRNEVTWKRMAFVFINVWGVSFFKRDQLSFVFVQVGRKLQRRDLVVFVIWMQVVVAFE